MAKDLDKLFRDQLANRSFEWNEGYWEAAEAAIVAAERKRRRRFAFFWWMGGVASLGLVLALWFCFGLDSQRVQEAVPAPMEKAVAGTAPQRGNLKPSSLEKDDDCATIPREEMAAYRLVLSHTSVIAEPAVLTPSQSTAAENFSGISVFDGIPGLGFSVLHEIRPNLGVYSPAALDTPVKPEDRSFAWRAGIGAGGTLAGMTPDALPGVWAGGMAQGQISGKWGWTAGLAYQVQQIPAFETGRTEQRKVQFGETLTQYVSEARSVHQVQLPLGVTYRMGRKWQLEAGAVCSYRLAVRGAIYLLNYPHPWERTPSEQIDYEARLGSYFAGETSEFPLLERSTVYAKGWLDSGRERAFQIQPFTGLQFHAGKRLSLSGRVMYRTGSPWPEGSEALGDGPWSAAIGAFYWIR